MHFFFNLGTSWGAWLTSRLGRFTLENEPVPIVLEAEWVPGPVWMGAENVAPTGFDPRTALINVTCVLALNLLLILLPFNEETCNSR